MGAKECGQGIAWAGIARPMERKRIPALPVEPYSSRHLACAPEALQEETLQWPSICLARPGKVWSQEKRTGRQSIIWREFYIK